MTAEPELSAAELLQRARWQFEELTGPQGPRLWGLPIVGAFTTTFGHIISERNEKDARARARALGEAWELLDAMSRGAEEVCWWREQQDVLLLSPPDFTILVALSRRRTSFGLLTVYPLREGLSRRRHAERCVRSWVTGYSFAGCFEPRRAKPCLDLQQWCPVLPFGARVREARGPRPRFAEGEAEQAYRATRRAARGVREYARGEAPE